MSVWMLEKEEDDEGGRGAEGRAGGGGGGGKIYPGYTSEKIEGVFRRQIQSWSAYQELLVQLNV